MEVGCLICLVTFGRKCDVEDHKCSNVHSFSCKHLLGNEQKFEGREAASYQHRGIAFNRRKNRRGCSSTVIQIQKAFFGNSDNHAKSPWTKIQTTGHILILSKLQENIHSLSTMLRYEYSTSSHPKQPGRRLTPKYVDGEQKRASVALDCEIISTTHNKNEPVSLTVIDYLTGEILIESLTKPEHRVVHWRSHITGITAKKMDSAEASELVLFACEVCRAELWKYIDSDTILVWQSLQNDLKALRVTYTTIVDCAILTSLVVNVRQTVWGLK
jgi:hypothetical protein